MVLKSTLNKDINEWTKEIVQVQLFGKVQFEQLVLKNVNKYEASPLFLMDSSFLWTIHFYDKSQIPLANFQSRPL